ncbi:MAG: hypothetical protein PHC61_13500, partial [Chitinivibrionales bacterium]|nr:hypothetical protein [Chitinivibrionales bacterium]
RDWQTEWNGSYADLQNDIAYDATVPADSNRARLLQWDKLGQYQSDMRLKVNGVVFSRLLLSGEGDYTRGGNSRAAESDNIYSHPPLHGAEQNLFYALGGAWLYKGDSLAVSLQENSNTKTRYSGRTDTSDVAHLIVSSAHTFTKENMAFLLAAQGGSASASYNGTQKQTWCGSLNARLALFGQNARFFISQDLLPVVAPYDTVPIRVDSLLQPFQSLGGEVMLGVNRLSLFVGYRTVRNLDSAAVVNAWPEQVAPYKQPRAVWSVAPMFGRFWGWGLYSRYMLSDARPFLKATAALSWEGPLAHDHAHLNADFSVNYWSVRDKIEFAGADDWNREIYDCAFTLAVQIKMFRLFYKMDNLLDRRLAYVPGYWMPGLTFRWGFSWIIQG